MISENIVDINSTNSDQVCLDLVTIEKYDTTGPRYTSYPTAVEFHEGIDSEDYKRAAIDANGALLPRDLSLYFHLPFCRHLCFYCGCNKIVTKNQQKSDKYLDYLFREIKMHGELIDHDRKVQQLHLGGGTPTYYSVDQIEMLMNQVRRYFSLVSADDRDYSIEIDPRTVGYQYLLNLKRLGFNRISLGVQDFNPQVQKAIHRIQPESQTQDLILQARSLGYQSINVDLICGLPKQNPDSFATTLDRIIKCAPDRISIYSYAHLPAMFPAQKRIHEEDLPEADEKIALYQMTAEKLLAAGYQHIGMDHFARPDDALAIALSEKTLHRSFQGYTTHKDCDLLGIGVSSIGSMEQLYYQNARDLDEYYRLLDEGQLPVKRGVKLSLDDIIRKSVIMQIMCEGKIDKAQIQQFHGIRFDVYFDSELKALDKLVDDGLLEVDDKQIRITPTGRFFLRNIAMVFDAYRQSGPSSRFSKVL
ncbi:MAG: oxygen-independent coproporphyrinogen III oxidase [Gammaproteobacteria bacterium]